jgi:hypothetical protein
MHEKFRIADVGDSSSSTELCDNVGDTDDEVEDITEDSSRVEFEIIEEGDSEVDSVAAGKEKATMSFIRRQRSFDAQKVIAENLEILEKLSIDKGRMGRNNSESELDAGDDDAPSVEPTINGDVDVDAPGCQQGSSIWDAPFPELPKAKQKKAKPFSNTTPVFIEPTKPIINPFPSRSRPRKTHNEVAVKLGLYSPSDN